MVDISLSGVVDCQVTEGNYGSKQFILSTSDGPIKYVRKMHVRICDYIYSSSLFLFLLTLILLLFLDAVFGRL